MERWGKSVDCILVGKSRLPVDLIPYVLQDFVQDGKENGEEFSFSDLRELVRMKAPGYFMESPMFERVRPYCLPFYKQETFK